MTLAHLGIKGIDMAMITLISIPKTTFFGFLVSLKKKGLIFVLYRYKEGLKKKG